MKKQLLLLMAAWCSLLLSAQQHPCYLTTPQERPALRTLIEQEAWAKNVYDGLKNRVDPYLRLTEAQPDWLLSRLAMYWQSHATEVYVRGEQFDHAGGPVAPVPTVRYTGTRGTAATHGRPRLADVVPYDDREGNVTFCNNALPGRPMESVHPSKTGRNIESLNREIVGIARDAAFLYWLTEEEAYARLAAGVFDTYMLGIYYRNVPIDLNHGHQQTLVGMTSFEVIHEDILNELVPCYDFLHAYLQEHYADRMDRYAAAFKKWAENIIANGVPHNNWNLIQARFITDIALILEPDDRYADRKGRDYYIDYVLNRSSIRQWSLKQLADYGYDPQTGIWAECPGYSGVVLNDYANFTALFDRNLHRDLTAELPVILQAVGATPQYLFPNRMICGFGDTHPGYLNTTPIRRMIANAQANGKPEQERRFTALLKALDPEADRVGTEERRLPVAVSSFFEDKPLRLDPSVGADSIEQHVSPLFYAPNVSWLVQRNGMSPRHSLMASLCGSLGNHAHANGIALELYGKGYVLGPDAGIGTQLYSGLDYAEYYSQFPSHNTVCVDGISSYPVMKSNHAFRVEAAFPSPNSLKGCFFPVSYSSLYFREPETQADQVRLTGIVTTGPQSGYYVDIFRSRKAEGGDKMHDYFYHNLGQTLALTAADGADLHLQPTEELAFAGAHLYAYSYLFDKRSATTDRDVRATFTIQMPDSDDIAMNLWMKGEPQRELFTALSPMTEGLSRTPGMPYDIRKQPTLTFVARQRGEAWSRPFVAIYEPSSVSEPGCIASVGFPEVRTEAVSASVVGIRVEQREGRTDRILSSDTPTTPCTMEQMCAQATYALWGSRDGHACTLFLGNGTLLEVPGIRIQTRTEADVLLECRDGVWFYAASQECTVRIGKKTYKVKPAGQLTLLGGNG